jgi:hypothetical protein
VRLDRIEPLVVGGRALVGAEQASLRGAVNVGVDETHLLAHPGDCNGDVRGQRRFPDSALAAGNRDQLPRRCACRHRHPNFGDARHLRRLLKLSFEYFSLVGAQPGGVGDDGCDAAGKLSRTDPLGSGKRVECS